jgi:phosphoglycerate dehydrogenase-like enzyme
MRLLIFELTFRRLADRFETFGAAVEPVLMAPGGALAVPGEAVSVTDAAATAAWFSGEVFERGATREFMAAVLRAPGLEWLQSAAAGFDHPIFAQLAAKGVRLTTSHGQAVGMADYAVAGVLDHFQRGPERRAAQGEKAWRRYVFREVLGTRWLILGFGAIGQGVAQRARAFGARVVGVRRDQSPHPLADEIVPPSAILDHLPTADVVVLCLPLNPATRRLADARFLAAMKRGSVIVNVGRGGLVDESALLAALETDAPGHALLDVFETEPLPAESPFWTHPKVVVTAHASSDTADERPRNEALFFDNLARFLSGDPLLNEVDPADIV